MSLHSGTLSWFQALTETTVCRYTCRSTRVHYPDSKPSLKQPSVGIHVAPLGYIILIPSPHWNNRLYVYMSLHSGTLSWFHALTETTVCRYTYRSTRVHYPDSKPSLKQPSVGIHIAPLGYIILIPSPHWNNRL